MSAVKSAECRVPSFRTVPEYHRSLIDANLIGFYVANSAIFPETEGGNWILCR